MEMMKHSESGGCKENLGGGFNHFLFSSLPGEE